MLWWIYLTEVGSLKEASTSFHSAASWYATATSQQWEIDSAQQFKFGLAYYNLSRMLGLQGLWDEALKVVGEYATSPP